MEEEFERLLSGVLHDSVGTNVPEFLFREADLEAFDRLDRDTVQSLLFDFYENRFAPTDTILR